MKAKRVLRFYFSVDRLNSAFDNLIVGAACRVDGGVDVANRVIELIQKKCELSDLWNYLDGVIKTFDNKEQGTLEFYGNLRIGISNLPPARVREVRRVVVKFTRRARGIVAFWEQLKILDYYRCLC